MQELKPCPFCDGEAYIKRINYGHTGCGKFVETYAIGCAACKINFTRDSEFTMECGAYPTFHKNGYEECVKAWNRRTKDENYT